MTIKIEDLNRETLEKLGLTRCAAAVSKTPAKPREFTAEMERQWAIKVLGPIAGLTKDQRRRVLERAIKMSAA